MHGLICGDFVWKELETVLKLSNFKTMNNASNYCL